MTKSVAATLVGIALGRGAIDTLDRPFLDFFKDRDLAKIGYLYLRDGLWEGRRVLPAGAG